MLEIIDKAFIEKDMYYCKGYAESLSNSDKAKTLNERDNSSVAATYFLRAAKHAMLLTAKSKTNHEVSLQLAKELLIQASEQYKKLESPFAMLLASLAGDRERVKVLNNFFQNHFEKNLKTIISLPEKATQLLYVVLADPETDFSKTIITLLEPLRHHRIGVLGLSVNQVINAIDLEDPSSSGLSSVLNVYDEALNTGSRNIYNFKRLLMNFHPVDVDIISILVCARRNHNFREMSYLERISITDKSKDFLLRVVKVLS